MVIAALIIVQKTTSPIKNAPKDNNHRNLAKMMPILID